MSCFSPVPSLLKYEPNGGGYTLAGNIYRTLGSRVRDREFGADLTSTSDFVDGADVEREQAAARATRRRALARSANPNLKDEGLG
ncbi:MAG TPA: hypothetical protein VER96_34035 [Polyangiaceae bacterium]|nr:hypothetical protein [Polyangiaceae bacterium]